MPGGPLICGWDATRVISDTITRPAGTCSATNEPSGVVGIGSPEETAFRPTDITITRPSSNGRPSRRRARPSMRPPCVSTIRRGCGSFSGSTSTAPIRAET